MIYFIFVFFLIFCSTSVIPLAYCCCSGSSFRFIGICCVNNVGGVILPRCWVCRCFMEKQRFFKNEIKSVVDPLCRFPPGGCSCALSPQEGEIIHCQYAPPPFIQSESASFCNLGYRSSGIMGCTHGSFQWSSVHRRLKLFCCTFIGLFLQIATFQGFCRRYFVVSLFF